MPISTIDELVSFIERKTMSHWEKNKTPYLLTYISSDLAAEEQAGYKSIIYPQTLKQFVSGLTSKFKLTQHPYQKTKIGLIPPSESFSYGESLATGVSEVKEFVNTPARRNIPPKYAVLSFLEAISKLEQDEARQINIPIHILAKLVSAK